MFTPSIAVTVVFSLLVGSMAAHNYWPYIMIFFATIGKVWAKSEVVEDQVLTGLLIQLADNHAGTFANRLVAKVRDPSGLTLKLMHAQTRVTRSPQGEIQIITRLLLINDQNDHWLELQITGHNLDQLAYRILSTTIDQTFMEAGLGELYLAVQKQVNSWPRGWMPKQHYEIIPPESLSPTTKTAI